jgi:hypothetical protein
MSAFRGFGTTTYSEEPDTTANVSNYLGLPSSTGSMQRNSLTLNPYGGEYKPPTNKSAAAPAPLAKAPAKAQAKEVVPDKNIEQEWNSSRNSGIRTSLNDAMKMGMTTVTNLSQASANLSQDELAAKKEEYKNRDKYWLDPTLNIQPEIEDYVTDLPSETQALLDGTMTGNMLGEDTAGSNAALGVLSVGASGFFDNKKQASYIMSKSGERAIEGASAGWVGAIVGGLEGIVEGALTWSDAEKKDKEAAKAAKRQYLKDLEVWQIKRNKMILDANNAYNAQRYSDMVTKYQADKAEKVQRKADAKAFRQSMVETLQNNTAAKYAAQQKFLSIGR